MEDKNGGQAFPCPASKCENAQGTSYNGTEGQDGMTLLDYFAGQALKIPQSYMSEVKNGESCYQATARSAYEIAVAMLEEKRRAE